jgi:hypothetical protein
LEGDEIESGQNNVCERDCSTRFKEIEHIGRHDVIAGSSAEKAKGISMFTTSPIVDSVPL